MDTQNYTTEHRKGQHLLAEERHEIEVRLKDGWSLDASVGKALESGKFHRDQMLCTKTLYNYYVDNGLIGIKSIDLPEKLTCNTKKRKVRKHKRILGDSIELRPESVESRRNLVIGKRIPSWAADMRG